MNLRKPKLLFPAVSALLALYYTLPFLLKLKYWGVRDWDLFTTIAAVPAGEILKFGQFPFWNPYLAGGNILFHHPEVAVLTPFFLLYLLFGAVVGLKLQVLIAYFLGFWGSQRLFRSLGAGVLASIVGSVAWIGSVHLALHFAEGHMPFTHYAFLPWFLYGVIEAPRNRKFLYVAIGALALMILGNGAAVPFLYTMMVSAILIGLRAIDSRKLDELFAFVKATALALLVSAVKFLPMVIYMVQNTWEGNPDERIPVSALGKIFFGLHHSIYVKNFPEQMWNWHEYGAYISPLLVLFALYLLFTRFRRHWYWIVIAGFFLLLGLGNFGALSPWALLSHMPGFSSMRATGRAFQFVIFPFAALGALGMDALLEKLRGSNRERIGRIAVYAAAGIVMATNVAFAWPIMSGAFHQPPKDVVWSPVFRNVIDDKPQAYENYLANRGSLISPWLSAYHPSRALVTADNVVLDDYMKKGRSEVKKRLYTPNVITYEVVGEGKMTGQMMIGMGYDVGWHALDGRPLTDTQGLITFPVYPGKQRVVLVYRTPFFYTGLVISLVTLAGLVVEYRRRSGKRGRRPDPVSS